MNKIKSIRQASKAMKERFPGCYTSVRLEMHSHPKSKTRTDREVYTSNHNKVWAKGKTWDEAFANLERHIELEARDE